MPYGILGAVLKQGVWGTTRVKKPQRAIEKLLRSYKGEVCRLLGQCATSPRAYDAVPGTGICSLPTPVLRHARY
eukprot:888866-Rhodomonas_salina.7